LGPRDLQGILLFIEILAAGYLDSFFLMSITKFNYPAVKFVDLWSLQ
jgi:hypothetical protein